MSSVDNVLESNNLLLTTKYSNTASSSSSVHVDSAASGGNLNNSVTLSTVTESSPVTLNSQFFSDDDSSDDDDMFNEWVKTIVNPTSSVIYGPKVPFPHLMLQYKVDSLIKRLKVDPGIPILHVPSKRSRSSSKASGGTGKAKKQQKAQGSAKDRAPLYSQSTPMVNVPSYRQVQNSN
jgi:hypothetical protein